jgi:malonate transporter MadM subunit
MNFLQTLLSKEGIVTAFALVGLVMVLSHLVSRHLTGGRVHGSAIAILAGIALAYWGGVITHGHNGLADVPMFAGLLLMGGGLLRDFAIVATAFDIDVHRAKQAGTIGVIALMLGTILPFLVGVTIARAYGYTDSVSLTTIGAGCITYIVGPVTGAALGASSPVMALSIAVGVLKAILVMIGTPFLAPYIGLDNSRAAIIYGGLMGTVSGVTGGLAATDPKLVPYGALVATFHTGFGCLVGPSILFLATRAIFG